MIVTSFLADALAAGAVLVFAVTLIAWEASKPY